MNTNNQSDADTWAMELRDVAKYYGDVVAVQNVSFGIRSKEWTAVLGPSGTGKTTTLRLVAGLIRPDAGTILIRGQDVHELRPYERNVGLVFQDYALFPNMSVEDNVAFGLRHRNCPREEIGARVMAGLKRVGLAEYGERWPRQLSGGQQQRVALARALVTEPAVLLLDEPLSNLDTALRKQMREDLRGIIAGTNTAPMIVTHDQDEALSLGDRIVVMGEGGVAQIGTPSEIYDTPANRFVADFVGEMNWLEVRYMRSVSEGLGSFVTAGGQQIIAKATPRADGGVLTIGVRPEKVLVYPLSKRRDTELNGMPGVVTGVEIVGAEVELSVRLQDGTALRSTSKRLAPLKFAVGDDVGVAFDAESTMVMEGDELVRCE